MDPGKCSPEGDDGLSKGFGKRISRMWYRDSGFECGRHDVFTFPRGPEDRGRVPDLPCSAGYFDQFLKDGGFGAGIEGDLAGFRGKNRLEAGVFFQFF